MSEFSNNVFHRPAESSNTSTSGNNAAAAAEAGTNAPIAPQAAVTDTAEQSSNPFVVRGAGVNAAGGDVSTDGEVAAAAPATEGTRGDVVDPDQGETADDVTPDAEESTPDAPAGAAEEKTDTVTTDAAAEGESDTTTEAQGATGGPVADGEVVVGEGDATDVAPGDATFAAPEDGSETSEDSDATGAADAGEDSAGEDGVAGDVAGEEGPAAETDAEQPADAPDSAGDDEAAADDVAADVEAADVADADAANARPAADIRGTTTVGDGVVVKLVNAAATKVEGVYALDRTGVEVADDVATITVSFVAEYGSPIRAVATKIRTDVIDAVENFLELDVEAVHVNVSDMHTPDPS